MKKRKKEKLNQNSNVNEYILNLIQPAGIDDSDNHASVGEGYGRIYAITKYPSIVDYGWLAPLCNLEGTSTIIEYRYAPPTALLKAFDRRIKDLKSKYDDAKNESEKEQYKKAIDDLKKMIKRISNNNEPTGYFNIMLHIQDMRYTDLENRIKKVNGTVSVQECGMRLLRFKQQAALKCVAPYYIPNRMVSNIGGRNMPMSTFTGGFPMAAAGIYDPKGYLLGRTRNMVAIVNMWVRGNDRTNSNWFISGVPGVGKSTFIKLILLMEYAINNTKIFMWDVENEYIEMARHPWINGDVIDAAGKMGRINPLHVRRAPKITEEDLNPGERLDDFLAYDEDHGTSDLGLHIQFLRVFFEIYFGKNAMKEIGMRARLEECLIATYKKFGITMDSDLSKLKAEDYPIISDLYETADILSKDSSLSERVKTQYEQLRDLLYPAAKGADKYLWNGPTTLNPKSNFIVFDTSNLLNMDDNVRNAQYYNMQTWNWHEISADRKEKCLLGIDEGYVYVDTDNPMLMRYFRNVSKRDRKYEAALMFISHAPADILDPAVKRHGQAIIDNSCYKMIMGCDSKNLEETKSVLKLSDKEELLLTSKIRGKGILFAGNTRLELSVEVPDKFLEIFGSGGGR